MASITMAEFLEELRVLIQRDEPLAPNVCLWDMDEWDSLAIMACMAWFDRDFGVKIKFNDLKDAGTVPELAAMAGLGDLSAKAE